MKHPITIPSMGESISEVTIGQILKPSGSVVKADDEILELETDKVNQVLYAPAAGVIQFSVSQGKVVKVGETIGEVDTDTAPSKASAPPNPSSEEMKPQEQKPPKQAEEQEAKDKTRITKEDYIASLKKEEVVTKETIRELPKEPQSAESQVTSQPAVPSARRERHVPMSRIRQVIAKKMVEAQHQSAMLTTFNEIDMSAVMTMRNKYKDDFFKKFQVKLGFMSFFVKAVIGALKAVPEINASITGDQILYRDYYDIGIAVGTDKGVFVPIVRDCDHKSFAEIEKEIAAFAAKGRDGKLSIDELSGGGFTITNGGVYGSLLSTPILNPPQSGILGMHKIEDRPVAVEGQVVIRPMMYVALSYDHRIVDGKGAVTFLVKVKEALEDPSRMVLDV